MTIYDRIKQLRVDLKMTQEELATKVGYKSRSAINKIEKGLRDINQSQVIRFAKALNTTTSYLMDGSNTLSKEKLDNKTLNNEPVILQKYNRLNNIDKGKTEAYVDGLLESPYYKENKSAQKNGPEEKTKIKFAARNGRFIEKEFTQEEKEELLKDIDALPDADDL